LFGVGSIFCVQKVTMPSILITNARLALPDQIVPNGSVWVEDGKIKAWTPGRFDQIPANIDVLDAVGKLLSPGFIDLHLYGGGGSTVIDGTADAIATILRTHAQHGTTGVLLTTVTAELPAIDQALKAIAKHQDNPVQVNKGANVLGIHIESCFLSVGKRGAHLQEWLRTPSIDLFQNWQDASGGRIKLLSIAPELNNADQVIPYVQAQGVIASFAHSEADFDLAKSWIDRGVRICTHLFNAMTGFSHRAPGAAGAFLSDDRAMVQIIADGVHVHPVGLELAYRCKGAQGICIVTDALGPAGTDLTSFHFFDRLVKVTDRACFLPDGTLAGSRLTMNRAVQIFADATSAPVHEVIRMATLNPATVLDLSHKKGSISVGKDADLVLLDDQFQVAWTMIEGQII
jgi:N-acetylglucosamine-6-phosphate deacetylase